MLHLRILPYSPRHKLRSFNPVSFPRQIHACIYIYREQIKYIFFSFERIDHLLLNKKEREKGTLLCSKIARRKEKVKSRLSQSFVHGRYQS